MTLEDQLLQQLVDSYRIKGKNIQSILDNQLFKDLPLDKKVKFIQQYRKDLETTPSFNWKGVMQGAAGGALGSGMAVRFGQFITNKADPRATLIAAGLGGVIGGIGSYLDSKEDHSNNLKTIGNLDNAILALIERKSLSSTDPFSKIKGLYKDFPEKASPAISREYYNNYIANKQN